MDGSSGRVQVNIPGWSMTPQGVVVYQIALEKNATAWSIKRRYQEFVALHAALRRFPDLPELPPKQVRLGMLSRLDPDFVEARRRKLEAYLQLLVAKLEVSLPEQLDDFLEYAEHCLLDAINRLSIVSDLQVLTRVLRQAAERAAQVHSRCNSQAALARQQQSLRQAAAAASREQQAAGGGRPERAPSVDSDDGEDALAADTSSGGPRSPPPSHHASHLGEGFGGGGGGSGGGSGSAALGSPGRGAAVAAGASPSSGGHPNGDLLSVLGDAVRTLAEYAAIARSHTEDCEERAGAAATNAAILGGRLRHATEEAADARGLMEALRAERARECEKERAALAVLAAQQRTVVAELARVGGGVGRLRQVLAQHAAAYALWRSALLPWHDSEYRLSQQQQQPPPQLEAAATGGSASSAAAAALPPPPQQQQMQPCRLALQPAAARLLQSLGTRPEFTPQQAQLLALCDAACRVQAGVRAMGLRYEHVAIPHAADAVSVSAAEAGRSAAAVAVFTPSKKARVMAAAEDVVPADDSAAPAAAAATATGSGVPADAAAADPSAAAVGPSSTSTPSRAAASTGPFRTDDLDAEGSRREAAAVISRLRQAARGLGESRCVSGINEAAALAVQAAAEGNVQLLGTLAALAHWCLVPRAAASAATGSEAVAPAGSEAAAVTDKDLLLQQQPPQQRPYGEQPVVATPVAGAVETAVPFSAAPNAAAYWAAGQARPSSSAHDHRSSSFATASAAGGGMRRGSPMLAGGSPEVARSSLLRAAPDAAATTSLRAAQTADEDELTLGAPALGSSGGGSNFMPLSARRAAAAAAAKARGAGAAGRGGNVSSGGVGAFLGAGGDEDAELVLQEQSGATPRLRGVRGFQVGPGSSGGGVRGFQVRATLDRSQSSAAVTSSQVKREHGSPRQVPAADAALPREEPASALAASSFLSPRQAGSLYPGADAPPAGSILLGGSGRGGGGAGGVDESLSRAAAAAATGPRLPVRASQLGGNPFDVTPSVAAAAVASSSGSSISPGNPFGPRQPAPGGPGNPFGPPGAGRDAAASAAALKSGAGGGSASGGRGNSGSGGPSSLGGSGSGYMMRPGVIRAAPAAVPPPTNGGHPFASASLMRSASSAAVVHGAGSGKGSSPGNPFA